MVKSDKNCTTQGKRIENGASPAFDAKEEIKSSHILHSDEEGYLKALLSYSTIRDVSAAAKSLLGRFSNLEGLFEADFRQIAESDCSNESVAHLIRLAVALNKRRMTESVKVGKKYAPEALEEYLKGLMLGNSVECVYMLVFDKVGRLLHTEFVSEGTVCASDVLPRKILDAAVRNKAHSVIIAHNHPGGDITPSSLDVFVTMHIKSVLKSAGVELEAHYIVAGGEVCKIDLSSAQGRREV